MKPLCVLQASVSPREGSCVDQSEIPKHSGSLVSLLTGTGCLHTLVNAELSSFVNHAICVDVAKTFGLFTCGEITHIRIWSAG